MLSTVLRLHLSVFAVLLFVTPLCASAQMVAMSLEELSRTSTEIVVGEAEQKRSFWNESRSQILTEITVRIDESIKGSAGSEVVITVPGGRVGNTLYEVSDMPMFAEGEDVLLFVWQHPTGRSLVNGGAQGKLEVVEEAGTGKRTLRGVPLAGPELGKTGVTLGPEGASGEAALDEVLTEIRSYLAN